MPGRFSRGWALTRQSWEVLRSDRSLAAFPVLAGAAALLLGTAFWAPAALLFNDGQSVLGVVVAAIGLYLVTFAGVFFNVALAGAAAQVMDGEDATVTSGLAVARGRVGAIAGWAAMLMSVNVIIRALQQRFGMVGDLILGGIAMAWNLVTFLAVPVIAFENEGPVSTLKRSARIFRDRWGEQVTGQVSVGVIPFLAGLVPAALLVGLGVLIGQPAFLVATIAMAVAILIGAIIISAALSQIFAVALYRFAVGETATGAFDPQALAGAVAPKGGRREATI
jgi:hypothetical protein